MALTHSGDRLLSMYHGQQDAIVGRVDSAKTQLLNTIVSSTRRLATMAHIVPAVSSTRFAQAARGAIRPSLELIFSRLAGVAVSDVNDGIAALIEREQQLIADAITHTMPNVQAHTDGLTAAERQHISWMKLDGKTALEWMADKSNEVAKAILNELEAAGRAAVDGSDYINRANGILDKQMNTLSRSFKNTHAAFFAKASAVLNEQMAHALDGVAAGAGSWRLN